MARSASSLDALRVLRLPLSLALMLAACSPQPRIELANLTGVPLGSVVVSGSGFRHEVGDMPAGATMNFAVDPTGDTGLAVECLQSDALRSHPAAGYFGKGGWEVRAELLSDGGWQVDGKLR